MSAGFGAAFTGLTLLAVLSGLAGLLALSLAGVVASRRWTKPVPPLLRSLWAGLVCGVVLVAGFGAVLLVDEAATLAAVFVGLVLIPLGAGGLSLYRVAELPRRELVATAGLAWSLSFLLGLAITFGVPIVINRLVDLAPTESRQLGLYWIATALGTTVIVLGTLRLSKRVSPWVSSVTTGSTSS